MTILTVRGLDPTVHARLRERAARHGRSMEAQARALISDAVLRNDEPVDLVALIRDRFAGAPAVLDIPARDGYQPPVEFDA